jgi:transcriptional regulator with XRE-family HTH domain
MVSGQPDRQTWEVAVATANSARIALGQRLRVARLAADIKSADVERHMGWHEGKVSRLEVGKRTLSVAEVDRIAALYRLPDSERSGLQALAQDARRREAPSRVADFAQTYLALEEQANGIDFIDEVLVPGLLQTEEYASALLAMSRADDPAGYVSSRLARQAILTRPNPPQLRVVLGEAALLRQVGGPEVLRAQTRHLLAVGELPNVNVRILPFNLGAHRALGVGFTVIRITDPPVSRVYLEGQTGATYLHEADDVDVYAADFEAVWSLAPNESHSATILRRHIGKPEDRDGR